ncbi:DUF7503 family protein [Halorussus salinisoli]
MTDKTITAYLAENPRMMGALFTLLLIMTQAGNATAANMSTVSGP